MKFLKRFTFIIIGLIVFEGIILMLPLDTVSFLVERNYKNRAIILGVREAPFFTFGFFGVIAFFISFLSSLFDTKSENLENE